MIGNAYAPSSLAVGLGMPVAAAGLLVVGYWLQRTTWRLGAWVGLLAVIAATHVWLLDEGLGVRLLGLLWLAAYAMKFVVAVESRRATGVSLSWWRWLAFAGLWFGMQPSEFHPRAASRRIDHAHTRRLVGGGAIFVVAGGTTILVAHLLRGRLGAAAWINSRDED